MNHNWLQFKLAFAQNAALVAGPDVRPHNRKELRDLLRTDPALRDVRKLVFGTWRTHL